MTLKMHDLSLITIRVDHYRRGEVEMKAMVHSASGLAILPDQGLFSVLNYRTGFVLFGQAYDTSEAACAALETLISMRDNWTPAPGPQSEIEVMADLLKVMAKHQPNWTAVARMIWMLAHASDVIATHSEIKEREDAHLRNMQVGEKQ